MLSYQHAYHAGNMADVHKHALLALVLEYMTRKPKPLTYMETHAGRALYALDGPEAQKTGEAETGVLRIGGQFPSGHPYIKALASARDLGGPMAYPGSPMIARSLLRAGDSITLAERHPAEAAALRHAMAGAVIREEDGPAMALSLCPPTPRRGVLLIDPSYEVKTEFRAMPELLDKLRRKWPVGVLMLWYPILRSGAETDLVRALPKLDGEKDLHHRLHFPPAREGHGMIGSGMAVLNAPWGLAEAAAEIERIAAA